MPGSAVPTSRYRTNGDHISSLASYYLTRDLQSRGNNNITSHPLLFLLFFFILVSFFFFFLLLQHRLPSKTAQSCLQTSDRICSQGSGVQGPDLNCRSRGRLLQLSFEPATRPKTTTCQSPRRVAKPREPPRPKESRERTALSNRGRAAAS